MNSLSLIAGLRFVDSFFPSGGYAFSSGLEAAVQSGAVRDARDLSRHVEDWLRHGIGRCDAVAAARVHQAAADDDLSSVLHIDRALESMKLCRETRLASRQMGRQVVRVAAGQWPGSTLLAAFCDAIESSRTPGHLAVSLALTLQACGWQKRETVAAYLYQSAVGMVSAALKLLPIGQREAQDLLAEWLPLIDELSGAVGSAELTSWTPIQDIYAMKHTRLTSRLFRS
jgi:urease accessory protein